MGLTDQLGKFEEMVEKAMKETNLPDLYCDYIRLGIKDTLDILRRDAHIKEKGGQ